jgi:hypothetical protein
MQVLEPSDCGVRGGINFVSENGHPKCFDCIGVVLLRTRQRCQVIPASGRAHVKTDGILDHLATFLLAAQDEEKDTSQGRRLYTYGHVHTSPTALAHRVRRNDTTSEMHVRDDPCTSLISMHCGFTSMNLGGATSEQLV